MDLKLIQKDIYKILSQISDNVFLDYLPSDNKIDFFNNIYVTYSIVDIQDTIDDIELSLKIQIVTNDKNKLEAQDLSVSIDKELQNTWFTDSKCKVIRSNVFCNILDDVENKNTIITLSYVVIN